VKETKFIELLNLYIDQQISPEEAARLEEEIIANPRRRRTYKDYCRLHRACTLVFENFRNQGDLADEPAWHVDAGDELPRRHRLERWTRYAAGLAAVACLALVSARVYRRVAPEKPAAPAASARTDAGDSFVQVRLPTRAIPVSVPVSERFVSQRLDGLSPLLPARGTSLVLTAVVPPPTALPPLSVSAPADSSRSIIEQFVFRPDPDAATGMSTVFRSRGAATDQEEMAAYQFQR
jgi:anti-sigma factor RsiW